MMRLEVGETYLIVSVDEKPGERSMAAGLDCHQGEQTSCNSAHDEWDEVVVLNEGHRSDSNE